jgi:hypothetical protein
VKFRSILWVAPLALLGACASLEGLNTAVQPPTFQVAQERQAELRIVGPSANRPMGGASVRLWARIHNPNPLGISLAALDGTLFLQGQQATQVNFPLGLPLLARQDTVIPFDIVVGFADVPRLAPLLLQAAERNEAAYRLDGTVRVDAGMLGQPVFGPMTFLEGTTPVRR